LRISYSRRQTRYIGDGQPLADIDEFCGKIKVGKDNQTNSNFSIVARIEALISGWGLDEALRRAEAYYAAGTLLMNLGSLSTIGAESLGNLIHIVLDNATYDSTGGQPTVSPSTNFAQVAIACGYSHADSCDNLAGLEAALASSLKTPGPHLIHVKIMPDSMKNLVRPMISPDAVARRFQDFLAKS